VTVVTTETEATAAVLNGTTTSWLPRDGAAATKTETAAPHAVVMTMIQIANIDLTMLTAAHSGTTRPGSGTADAAAEMTTIVALAATIVTIETDEIATEIVIGTAMTPTVIVIDVEIATEIETVGEDMIPIVEGTAAGTRVTNQDLSSTRTRSGSMRRRRRSSIRIISR
jgi:hypothetical protein